MPPVTRTNPATLTRNPSFLPEPLDARATRRVTDAFETPDAKTALAKLQRDLSPTYTVGGVSVSVPAPFRMNGGNGQITPDASKQLLTDALKPRDKATQDAINRVAYGRGTPAQVKLLTEKLIAAGQLDPQQPANADELKTAVRNMQWKFGVGVDCNGYCQLAYRALTGREPVKHWGDAFSPNERTFTKVALEKIQPGDFIKLADPFGGVGHNVVVTDVSRANGRLTMTVASSWGASGVATNGGVGKHTWVYDEATKKWGELKSGGDIAWSSTEGPYNHDFTGVYRPK